MLKKLVTRLSRSHKGFTLIELLVVIAILGVLTAVVLPNVISLMHAGDLAAASAEKATVQTAVDGYIMQNPDMTSSDIDAIIVGPAAVGTPGVLALIRGGSVKGTYAVNTAGTVEQTATGY